MVSLMEGVGAHATVDGVGIRVQKDWKVEVAPPRLVRATCNVRISGSTHVAIQ